MSPLDTFSKIAGVTHSNDDGTARQDLIEELADRRDQANIELTLRRDPHNPHDANAVAVLTTNGQQLGFLPRKCAETVARIMDRGVAVRASVAMVTGGGLTQAFGVNIRIWSE